MLLCKNMIIFACCYFKLFCAFLSPMIDKTCILKGVALVAVAFTVASCHKGWGEVYDEDYQNREFQSNFKAIVMNGQDIDPRQTWNTAVTTSVQVKTDVAGVLKVYGQNPLGQCLAPLYTATVAKGETKSFAVAKPQSSAMLFATISDTEGYIVSQVAFAATESAVSADFGHAETGFSRFADMSRAMSATHVFPAMPADADFASEVPADALPEDDCNGGGQGVNVVISHAVVDRLDLWKEGSTVYFPAGSWIVNDLQLGAHSTVYLLPGANVTFNGKYEMNAGQCKMYIAQGARFEANAVCFNFNLYNRGTIETATISHDAQGFFCNEGSVTCSGKVTLKDKGAELVNGNGGLFTAASMVMEGAVHVLNQGQFVVTGDVVINSSQASWVNEKLFHCKNFYYKDGGSNVINSCKLICDELFSIDLSSGETNAKAFKLEGSIETNNLYHGNGRTIMAGGAVVKVTETITCNGTVADGMSGFYGPAAEGQYAVVQAAKVTAKDIDQKGCVVYTGHVVIATDSHWADCDARSDNFPHFILDTSSGAKMGDQKSHVPAVTPTECNVGLVGGSAERAPRQYVYFAFETLGTSDDFDYNDVVVRVSTPNDNGKASVELCALGDTQAAYLFCGSDKVAESELHTYIGMTADDLYGRVDGKGNTNKSTIVTKPFEIGQVTVPDGSSVADLDLYVKVIDKDGQTNVFAVPDAGDVPFRIVVCGDGKGQWFWSKERRNICDAYTLFGMWGANRDTANEWYGSYVDDYIVKW